MGALVIFNRLIAYVTRCSVTSVTVGGNTVFTVWVPTNSSQLVVTGATNTISEISEVRMNSVESTLQEDERSFVVPSANRSITELGFVVERHRPTKSAIEHMLVCACVGMLTATTIGVVQIPLRNNRRVLLVIFIICFYWGRILFPLYGMQVCNPVKPGNG